MTKEKIILIARRAANRTGKDMAVLNLNPYSPLYVVREWNDHYNYSKDLVLRVYPSTIDGD